MLIIGVVTEELKIELPFKCKIIKKLNIKEKLNKHSKIIITGILDNNEENMDIFRKLGITDNLKIKGKRILIENKVEIE